MTTPRSSQLPCQRRCEQEDRGVVTLEGRGLMIWMSYDFPLGKGELLLVKLCHLLHRLWKLWWSARFLSGLETNTLLSDTN
jgi:hypothetical protein